MASVSAVKPTRCSLNLSKTPTRLFNRSGPTSSLSFKDTPSCLVAASITIRTCWNYEPDDRAETTVLVLERTPLQGLDCAHNPSSRNHQ